MPTVFGLSLAFSAALMPSTGTIAQNVQQPMPQAQTIEQYVSTYFADEPIMIAIARCESRFRQYNTDGSVLRGEQNGKDVGVMQINEYYHSAVADKLGLDLYTLQGNTAYAHYLYSKQGTSPWSASEPCWGKSKAALHLVALAASKSKN